MSRRNDLQPLPPSSSDADHTSDSRLTEQPNPRTRLIDTADTGEILDLLFAEDRTVAGAVQAESSNIAALVDAVANAVR